MATVVSMAPQDESCALACGCGWTDAVTVGSRKTVAQARSAAIERARAHLRGQHGAESYLERRLPGNVREISGVNERLLDEDQRGHYTELVRAANFRGSATNSKRKYRMKFRDGMRSYLALALWVAVLVPLVLLMLQEESSPEPHPDPFLWLMVACLLLGWIPAAVVLVKDAERWRLRLVSTYLDSIDFEQHDPNIVRREYGDSDYDDSDHMSKRQRDHLWYGDHSELNWRDREQAQAWGMDADTYVSNWLEDDKE